MRAPTKFCLLGFNTLALASVLLLVSGCFSRPTLSPTETGYHGQICTNYTIAGDTFHVAYTNSSDRGFLTDYLLKKQTLEDWDKLFAVRYFKQQPTIKEALDSLNVKSLRKRMLPTLLTNEFTFATNYISIP